MSDICPICVSEYDDNAVSLDCEHQFCKSCLSRYIEDKIEDGEKEIRCPYEDCDDLITEGEIGEIIGEEYLLKYVKIHNYLEDKAYSQCAVCGHVNDKSAYDNKIVCNNCNVEYCFVCHEEHDYYRDYDYCPNEGKIEETLKEISDALGSDDVKPCPVCKIIMYKEEGCASVKCKNCKVKFCWHCSRTRSQIDGNDHICPDYYHNNYHATDSDEDYVDGF